MSEGQDMSSFEKAAKQMADFFAGLLDKDTADSLIEGWVGKEKRAGSSGDFDAEFEQASVAASFASKYEPEQIDAFRQALEKRIIDEDVHRVSVDYHPDKHLKYAGEQAGISLGMLDFPARTYASYDASEEMLKIREGGAGEVRKTRLNPDRPITYGYVLYQVEPGELNNYIEMDKDEAKMLLDGMEAIDEIVSDAEGVDRHTINFVGLIYTTSPGIAIEHAEKIGLDFSYMDPEQVTAKWEHEELERQASRGGGLRPSHVVAEDSSLEM